MRWSYYRDGDTASIEFRFGRLSLQVWVIGGRWGFKSIEWRFL